MLELSDGLRSALELSRTPDHSTLWWCARHKLKPELLQAALEEWVEPQMLVAQLVRAGPSGDFGDLVPLAESANSLL